MIWIILVTLGVPLWVCAAGITALVFRNRALRNRDGNIPVRVLRSGHNRWIRGHGLWVANVFAWRGSPAAWAEDLMAVGSVQARTAAASELRPLRRLGVDPAVAVLTSPDGGTLTIATAAQHEKALRGPFAGKHVGRRDPRAEPPAGGDQSLVHE
jgi:hypothetical protein